MPYPGGVGGHGAQPALCRCRLRLASIFLSIRETWIRIFFEKRWHFWGRLGVPPVIALLDFWVNATEMFAMTPNLLH